jgi:hypothetical protein
MKASSREDKKMGLLWKTTSPEVKNMKKSGFSKE